jgi:hypothetical protein
LTSIKKVMISSTARDLPEHRKHVMDACISQGMFPLMMEYLPATHEDALAASLKMVDEADIYIGIFAYRYGYIPAGYDVSITEMEYQRAIERNIPVLVFMIAPNHGVTGGDVEAGAGAEKLSTFKKRLEVSHVVNYFKSPEDLRAYVINSLVNYRVSEKPQPVVEPKDFSPQLQTQMALLNKTIGALTAEQYSLMEMLRYQKRVSIAGCAGSGKTLLAVDKAIRLDTAGVKTLFLCHSRNLAEHVQFLLRGTRITVLDFTTWVYQIANQSAGELEWDFYVEPTDELLELAFDALNDDSNKYDAVIVDEAQDFRELWWTLIEAAMRRPEYSILYIFFDDNQILLPRPSKYPIIEAPIALSKNCRNSGNIFEFIRVLHPQSPETSFVLQGQGIFKKDVFVDSDEGEAKVLEAANEIYNWFSPSEPKDLVVLTSEPEPVSQTSLNNLALQIKPPWRWQDSVEKYLGDLPLSEALYPTEDDMELVSKTASSMIGSFRANTNYSHRLKMVHWQVFEDTLHLLHPFGNDLHGIRSYFTLNTWANGIPEPEAIMIRDAKNASEGDISLFTISAFKGLEAAAVILYFPYPFQGDKKQLEANLYVGASRAKFYLHIIAQREIALGSILRRFKG